MFNVKLMSLIPNPSLLDDQHDTQLATTFIYNQLFINRLLSSASRASLLLFFSSFPLGDWQCMHFP